MKTQTNLNITLDIMQFYYQAYICLQSSHFDAKPISVIYTFSVIYTNLISVYMTIKFIPEIYNSLKSV